MISSRAGTVKLLAVVAEICLRCERIHLCNADRSNATRHGVSWIFSDSSIAVYFDDQAVKKASINSGSSSL